MDDNFDANGDFTPDYRATFPEMLGDVYYNDPETRQKPTKELDNVKNVSDALKMVVTGSRKISAHGEELKNVATKATEGMIKIPGEGATVEEIAAYREAQGVPKDVSGYELPIPEDEANKAGNEAIAKEVAAAAHEAGIPKSKLTAVWNKVVPALAAQAQALEKQGNDLLAADVQALKDVKKDKYDSFIIDTDKVAAHFDIKANQDAGTKENLRGTEFMKLMEGMGIKDVPVVREFLGAIAPLVLEGSTALGGPAPQAKSEGGFDYDYDEKGKPV